jgi:exopolysaccharide production protein ExoQ
MQIIQIADRPNLFSLTSTWLLCGILLVFASLYGFSFERGTLNSFSKDAQAMGAGDAGREAVVKIQSAIVYLVTVLLIFPVAKRVWQEILRNRLMGALLLWCALSVTWSALPSFSAINAVRMALNLALVFYLFEKYSANDLQKLFMLVGAVAAAGSLLMVFFFPQYGLQTRGTYALGAWEGIFGQKNLCGLNMLLLLLPALFVRSRRSDALALRLGYSLVMLLIITMTRSTGAWIVGGLCLSAVGLLKLTVRMPRKDAAAICIPLFGLTVLAIGGVLLNFSAMMYALGKDPTMTGRTVLWSGLLTIGMKHAVHGFGYTAFWQGPTTGPTRTLAIQMGWLGLAQAENGILELWLELGLVGLMLYAALFTTALGNALYCLQRGASQATLWYTSILFYVGASNIEGGSLLTPSFLICMLPFVAFIGLKREAQRLRQGVPS